MFTAPALDVHHILLPVAAAKDSRATACMHTACLQPSLLGNRDRGCHSWEIAHQSWAVRHHPDCGTSALAPPSRSLVPFKFLPANTFLLPHLPLLVHALQSSCPLLLSVSSPTASSSSSVASNKIQDLKENSPLKTDAQGTDAQGTLHVLDGRLSGDLQYLH